MKETFEPSGFYFCLQVDGFTPDSNNAFQEASGLTEPSEAEETQESGQNRYQHRLPATGKTANLVLRRGFMSRNSALAAWVIDTISGNLSKPIQTRTVLVSLLDGNGTPLANWSFRGAWPVKVSMSDFEASEDALAIETLEFAYSSFQRQ